MLFGPVLCSVLIGQSASQRDTLVKEKCGELQLRGPLHQSVTETGAATEPGPGPGQLAGSNRPWSTGGPRSEML